MTAAVSVVDVGLVIGGARILDGVTIAAEPGEMIGVIGPNGAGKTTLFNVVSGVRRPTEGRVLLDEMDVTAMPIDQRARLGLGRTFQTSSLFPRLSVLENVRLAVQTRRGRSRSIARFPRAGDEATAEARLHLAEVDLSRRAGVAAGDLSHGDKRKVEIAVLLAMEPKVVLLDEPMAGVATADVPSLTAVISRLHRELGCAVLMVEHHIDVVLGLVDRVAVLHHGSLLAIGTPDDVVSNSDVQSAYLGDVA